MIIEQSVSIEIDGISRSDYVESFTLTEETNRIYQVCTMKVSCGGDTGVGSNHLMLPRFEIFPEQTVSIIVTSSGISKIFDGFVFSLVKVGDCLYDLQIRSESAKLTEPFYSYGDFEVCAEGSSHAVVEELTHRENIDLDITTIDLDTGGGYVRNGTPLSSITALSNTTGAEYWFDCQDNILRIHPNKAIQETGRILSDFEIFDYMPLYRTIYQRGIKYVYFGKNFLDTAGTITSSASVEVDGCTRIATVGVVPISTYMYSDNINLKAASKKFVQNFTTNPTRQIKVKYEIDNITRITMNGGVVTDYTAEYNVITFSSEKRGYIIVDYVGKILTGRVNVKKVDEKDYSEFDVFYDQCKVSSFSNFLSCNSASNGPNTRVCGGYTIQTPDTMNYASGFDFQVAPMFTSTPPKVSFYSGTEIIRYVPERTQVDLPWVERTELLVDPTGSYYCETVFPIITLTEVRSNGEDITAHTTVSGNRINFDTYYSNVVIAYDIYGWNYYVQFVQSPNSEVTMLVEDCDFALEGQDLDSTSSYACVVGMTIAIDMIAELGVSPYKAIDKNVTVTYPNSATAQFHTDHFGILYVQNTQLGDHNINVNNIKPGAKMTLTVTGPDLT